MRAINLENQRFGRLLVIKQAGVNNGHWFWECLCDCGNRRVISSNSLRRGKTQSCGCLGAQHRLEASTTHGLSHSSEYRIWFDMIRRCYDPTRKSYADYGGRGIDVCDSWRESFEAFYLDMGKRPTPQHTIDRVNNALGYSKDNCRWATKVEQVHNRRQRKDSVLGRVNNVASNEDVAEIRSILLGMLKTNVSALAKEIGLSIHTCYRILSGQRVTDETIRKVKAASRFCGEVQP